MTRTQDELLDQALFTVSYAGSELKRAIAEPSIDMCLFYIRSAMCLIEGSMDTLAEDPFFKERVQDIIYGNKPKEQNE